MWYRNRVWIHYIKNVIAADISSAVFLVSYTKRIGLSKEYAATLEIFDLQRYKVIRQAAKVRSALSEKRNKPFIFVACKN